MPTWVAGDVTYPNTRKKVGTSNPLFCPAVVPAPAPEVK